MSDIKTRSALESYIDSQLPDGTGSISAADLRAVLDSIVRSAALKIDSGEVEHIVINMSTTSPPGSPSDGDTYVVASGATGDWAGEDNNVAIWDANESPADWDFVPATDGMVVWNLADDKAYRFDTGISPAAWSEQTSDGSNSWSLVDEHDFSSTPASEFVVTGIDNHNELLIIGTDLDAASISSIIAYLSTDGGSTYLTSSGDYHRQATAPGTFDIGGDNDEAFIMNGSPQAAGGHCRFVVENMGSATIRTSWSGRGANDSGNNSFEFGMTNAAAVHDAIKFEHSNATNLNAGSIHVYGR